MMLTIELNPELEAQLREEAVKTGTDATTFIVGALAERLRYRNGQSIVKPREVPNASSRRR